MTQKENIEDCECDLPEIRAKFVDGKCSCDQIWKCHGHDHELIKKLKAEGRINCE
jgi:hypothetical protein